MRALKHTDHSIVVVDKFIHATRDSGYKGTASAVAELIDNSLQASARTIRVQIAHSSGTSEHPLELSVLDDGTGMSRRQLQRALCFGGSSRFDDRTGLGRYGMGLPNSSLSQARRVTVYTWRSPRAVYSCYLDVDEVAAGVVTAIPEPTRAKLPMSACPSHTGTLVRWSCCDRFEHRRISTIAQKLALTLGRRFRYYLWAGVDIRINDVPVSPVDPLFLDTRSEVTGAKRYGAPLEYRVRVPGDEDRLGFVRVTFSELPVREWHAFSNSEKRQKGISKGAGVSLVRADREVDYGWFFMGSKRRENYDDWWRCEVSFDPVLDEAFGLTHTKQQVRPQAYISALLTPDVEATARTLNSRVRAAHMSLREAPRATASASIASAQERYLKPIEGGAPLPRTRSVSRARAPHHTRESIPTEVPSGARYTIKAEPLSDHSFFAVTARGDEITLLVNIAHPFYKTVYKPLVDGSARRDSEARTQLELLLLAAARAEVAAPEHEKVALSEHRHRWSNTLSTFLNG